MPNRTCTADGCARPHWARGLCSSHYGTWHRKTHGRTNNHVRYEVTCIVCGAQHLGYRPTAKFCSDACKGRHYSQTMRRKSTLPHDHPVMLLIAEAKAEATRIAAERREQRAAAPLAWRTARECPGCACMFTPLYTPNAICCSKRCARRVHRRRRRAAEANAIGTFIWSDFMRIARRFGYRCAYCGDKPGALDPDHVVPLSRGGLNSTTNLLPSCRPCNADKRDLLLHEWQVDREMRGKPPRATTWAPEDRRYTHLTQATLISPAA